MTSCDQEYLLLGVVVGTVIFNCVLRAPSLNMENVKYVQPPRKVGTQPSQPLG